MLSAFALILKSPLLLLRAMQQPKKKVRNIIGMFAVFLCVSGTASAAGVHAVPASRISVRLPAGMVAQAHTSDGSLNLTIDSQKTDWGRVLLQGSDMSYVDVIAGIKAPEGAHYYVMECGSGNTEEEILSWLDDYESEDHSLGTLA